LCCRLPLFFPQQGGCSSHSLMGVGACLQSQWGVLGLCALWGDRPGSTSRVAGCHSVEELGFQLLDRRDVAHLQGGAVWPWGNRTSGAAWRVAGFSFPPLSGESGILALWWRSKGSLAVRDSREASPLCSVGREAFWHQQNSKAWSLGSFRHVVMGSWHWVASWGYPWGSKASRFESFVA
jgi:hypothetical protein